ncbi:MAG TPA: CAP domain-containing protein [Nevskiaceae bacterium]|nr:CAP domain-containing protein [Nevskiaceae bacterium]
MLVVPASRPCAGSRRLGVRALIAAALTGLAGCTAPPPATPPSPPGTRTSEPEPFVGTLAAHARWRREVGTGDLVWSDAAARVAQGWADHLARDNACEPAHSPLAAREGIWGENVYSYWRGGTYDGYRRTPAAVVDSWASEKRWYVHASDRCVAPAGETCGHYTQVVSTYSTHVGCGRARCPSAEIWVCNYGPPGNLHGVPPW